MKKRLLTILKKDAFFKKRIRLSSGKISNYYIDVRRASLDSEGLWLIARVIWNMIKKERPTAVGGPTLGADSIVGAILVLAYRERKKLKGFLLRKAPKKHGRQNLIEGKELTPKDTVVIIDDVATTGGSLIKALTVLRTYRIKVVRAVVVVDREEGAREEFIKRKCPFTSLFRKKDFL